MHIVLHQWYLIQCWSVPVSEVGTRVY